MKLMERLFAFENFQIENFDRDFNQFLNRSFFVNHELTKKFLQRERVKIDELQQVILQKNSEISGYKKEIHALEKVAYLLQYKFPRKSSKPVKNGRCPSLRLR
jgi:hypothetical protein